MYAATLWTCKGIVLMEMHWKEHRKLHVPVFDILWIYTLVIKHYNHNVTYALESLHQQQRRFVDVAYDDVNFSTFAKRYNATRSHDIINILDHKVIRWKMYKLYKARPHAKLLEKIPLWSNSIRSKIPTLHECLSLGLFNFQMFSFVAFALFCPFANV